eukprot:12897277-Prorocentrum_lima.AAC.1
MRVDPVEPPPDTPPRPPSPPDEATNDHGMAPPEFADPSPPFCPRPTRHRAYSPTGGRKGFRDHHLGLLFRQNRSH